MNRRPSADEPFEAGAELIELAAVTRAHGLRGEVLLKLFNPDSDALFNVTSVVAKAADGALRTLEVESIRPHGQVLLAAFTEIQTRNDAEALRGSRLCVPRSALPPAEEGKFYFMDLVGLEARDEGGEVLGPITEVLDYPSVDCLVVDRDGASWEIPNLDRYVVTIDVAGGFVVMRNLEELADLQPKGG